MPPALHPFRILLTAPRSDAAAWLCQNLEALEGVELTWVPLLHTEPVSFSLPSPDTYDWLFFTSKNAVPPFFERLSVQNDKSVAAVGPATAEALQPYGQTARFIAPMFNAHAAAEAFAETYASQSPRVLWPCGNLAHPDLMETLTRHGISVTPCTVYKTVIKQQFSPDEQRQLDQPFALLIFTSPSAVKAYLQWKEPALVGVMPVIACIGPKTAQSVKSLLGVNPHLPSESTMESLFQCIRQVWLT